MSTIYFFSVGKCLLCFIFLRNLMSELGVKSHLSWSHLCNYDLATQGTEIASSVQTIIPSSEGICQDISDWQLWISKINWNEWLRSVPIFLVYSFRNEEKMCSWQQKVNHLQKSSSIGFAKLIKSAALLSSTLAQGLKVFHGKSLPSLNWLQVITRRLDN